MSAIDGLTSTYTTYPTYKSTSATTNSNTTSTDKTQNPTFISQASDAVASGDVNALIKALATAKSTEKSVYGATGILEQAGTQSGWDLLMGKSSSSGSSSNQDVFTTLTPDIVAARTENVSSVGNLVNTKA